MVLSLPTIFVSIAIEQCPNAYCPDISCFVPRCLDSASDLFQDHEFEKISPFVHRTSWSRTAVLRFQARMAVLSSLLTRIVSSLKADT